MLIEGQGVTVNMDGRPIISGQTVRCAPGTMTALVGPSGSGKTTLLHALGQLLPVASGQILFDGRDVSANNDRQRRRFWRDHAAFVLQDYGIIDDESVSFNTTLRRGRSRGPANIRLASILHDMGLAGREDELASHLSGGEKQRLALARALFRDASALFVDEPTASLDAMNRSAVIDLLSLFARRGATVIISSHDDEMIAACSSRHVMTVGGADAVVADPVGVPDE